MRPYLVVDIEGSTGTWSREDTLTGTARWHKARRELTEDVNEVVEALTPHSALPIVVKDFHRDGFNIVPSLLHRHALLVRGYYFKPLLMYGDIRNSTMAFFIGMHAASGNRKGFLPHTLTSGIAEILVNGEPLCETQIFAHVLGEAGVPVSFVSGCEEACAEARRHMPWVVTCAVPKDESVTHDGEYARKVRGELREKAAEAALLRETPLYRLLPPFTCQVTFRDEQRARKARAWGFCPRNSTVAFESARADEMVLNLIKLAYFTPLVYRFLPYLLPPARFLLEVLDHFR